MRRLRIRIDGAYCRSALCLTTVHVAAGTSSLIAFDGDILIKYTTVCNASTHNSSFSLDSRVMEHCHCPLVDRSVDLFCHSILEGCVGNNLLVSDPFVRQVLVEGSGGVFPSIVGFECLHFD